MLSLQASLVNGWNDDPDVNAWKTFGLSASHHGQPDGRHHRDDLLRQGSARRRAATETPGDLRILADLVAALTLSDKLGVNLNFDYVKAPAQRGATTSSASPAMARYVISDHLNVAARGEWCASHTDGATVNSDVMEGTVMLGSTSARTSSFGPEFRIDHFGQSRSFSSNGQERPGHRHARRADVLLDDTNTRRTPAWPPVTQAFFCRDETRAATSAAAGR